VFIKLKEYLANPPVLCKPQPSMPLSLYLAVIDQAISSALVQEQDQFQKLICFVSRIWQEPEERYQVPGKAALLVSRQLSPVWTVLVIMSNHVALWVSLIIMSKCIIWEALTTIDDVPTSPRASLTTGDIGAT